MRRLLASLVLAAFAGLSPLGMAQATGDRIDFILPTGITPRPALLTARSASGTFSPAATLRTQPKKQRFYATSIPIPTRPWLLMLPPKRRALKVSRRSTSSTPATALPRRRDRPSISTATSRS